jgi:hypothetical protein
MILDLVMGRLAPWRILKCHPSSAISIVWYPIIRTSGGDYKEYEFLYSKTEGIWVSGEF